MTHGGGCTPRFDIHPFRIDEAGTAIAERIRSLFDKVNAGTAAPEEIAAILQPDVDRLTELGQDPLTPGQ